MYNKYIKSKGETKMKFMTGMVFGSSKNPSVFNEITRLYTENGKKMVEVSQFSKDFDDVTVRFYERELNWGLRRGLIYLANNWQSMN